MERERQYLQGINNETVRVKITAWIVVSVLVTLVGTFASRQAFPNQSFITTAIVLASVCAIVVVFQGMKLYKNTQKIDAIIAKMDNPSVMLNFNLYIKKSISEFPILVDGQRLIVIDTFKAIVVDEVVSVDYHNQRFTGKNQDIFTITYKDGSTKVFKLLTHPEVQELILKYIKALNPNASINH